MRKEILIGMAGSGGDGVILTGELLARICTNTGYYIYLTKSYGPQIRGGESSFRLRISQEPVHTAGHFLDIGIALAWKDFQRFGELQCNQQSHLICEQSDQENIPIEDQPANLHPVDLEGIATEAGSRRARNMVVLGILCQTLGLPAEHARTQIEARFVGKKNLPQNLTAFNAGLEQANSLNLLPVKISVPQSKQDMMLADGNQLCAAAAIFAGCRFFAGYPITPASEIMHYFSQEVWKYGGSMLQMEDEIAGVGAALGASFAGQKAMTATSGPGMDLKTEIIGLATLAEIPLVIVNVQRGGPSTGLPTRSEQSDLLQAAFGAHGDFIRPVIAPTDVADVFPVTVEAFNLAEAYQTPVILLSDQSIAQRKESFAALNPESLTVVNRKKPDIQNGDVYDRYKLTPDDISPLSHPGMPGAIYQAGGIEHNENGRPDVSGRMHAIMAAKRERKFKSLEQRQDLFEILGDPEAELALLGWGSSAGPLKECLQIATEQGYKVKLLIPRLIFPVSITIYKEFFENIRAGLIVEHSLAGQFNRLLRMYLELPTGLQSFACGAGTPIFAADIFTDLKRVVANI